MKTKITRLLPLMATLVMVNLAGCDSASSASNPSPKPSTGPLTSAATLSGLKTFDVVGRLSKDGTQSPIEAPAADVVAQTVRDEVQAKGYQLQSTAPDFLVLVGWIPSQKLMQSDMPGPPDVKIDQVTLYIAVRDRATNEILWTNPSSMPIETGSVTADGVRGMARQALRDFPPTQPAK